MALFPSSLDVNVVRNSIRSRWFVVHKPAGFAMATPATEPNEDEKKTLGRRKEAARPTATGAAKNRRGRPGGSQPHLDKGESSFFPSGGSFSSGGSSSSSSIAFGATASASATGTTLREVAPSSRPSKKYRAPSLTDVLQVRNTRLEPRYPFHLDTDTEGLVLVTKDESLRQLVRASSIERRYRLVADVRNPRFGAAGSRFHPMAGALQVVGTASSSSKKMNCGEESTSETTFSSLAKEGVLASYLCSAKEKTMTKSNKTVMLTPREAAEKLMEFEEKMEEEQLRSRSSTDENEDFFGGKNKAHDEVEVLELEDAEEDPQLLSASQPQATVNGDSVAKIGPSCGGATEKEDDDIKQHRLEFSLLDAQNGLGLYDVRVVNPAPHQVRVQFAEAGAAVVGDPLYGKKSAGDSDSHFPLRQSSRLAMQLYSLRFPDPCDPSQLQQVALEEPAGFDELLGNVR